MAPADSAVCGGRAARRGKASYAFIGDVRAGGRGEVARAGRGRPVRWQAGGQEQGRTAARVPGRGQAGSTDFGAPRCACCLGTERAALGRREGGSGVEVRRHGAAPASASQKCFLETLVERAKLPKVE
jgi:hypothetical protein